MSLRLFNALATAAAFGAASAAYAWRESRRVELAHRVVRPRGLPAGLDGLRILHVSDTHFPADGSSVGRFLEVVERARFDLVAATGDYVETSAGWDAAVEALAALPRRAPAYAVLGAHDYLPPVRSAAEWTEAARERIAGRRRMISAAPFRRRLGEAGIRVLRNEWREIEIRGERLRIAGAGDASADMARLAKALPPDGDAFTILLTHAPDAVLDHAEAGHAVPPLTLAGHTHGGQIAIPGYGAPFRHSRLATRRKPAGLFDVGGGKVLISRGFGTAIVPLRIQARPELTVVELRRAPPAGSAPGLRA